jgi:hypothetical protein
VSTPNPLHAALDRLIETGVEIHQAVTGGRIHDVLEVIRDHVTDLAREHDGIRDEIREVFRRVMARQQTS